MRGGRRPEQGQVASQRHPEPEFEGFEGGHVRVSRQTDGVGRWALWRLSHHCIH